MSVDALRMDTHEGAGLKGSYVAAIWPACEHEHMYEERHARLCRQHIEVIAEQHVACIAVPHGKFDDDQFNGEN